MSAALALPLATCGTPAAAQDQPPAPLPSQAVRWPPFHERTLSNGARLLVVPQREMPFVTVNLVLPGGRAADPGDRVGLADLTAELLLRGAAGRGPGETLEAVAYLGAELEVSSGTDWTTVSARALTPHLPAVLGLMADAVLRPTFPPREMERARQAALAELDAELASPASLADRAFMAAVYGDHPYGKLETRESLQAIDRASVVEFHRTWYRPAGALFVVAGDVTPDAATELLERVLRGWAPGPDPDPVVRYGLPPLRHAPRVVIVHHPGTAAAHIRIGHTLVRGDHADWTALSTLDHVLGGGPRSGTVRRPLDRRGPAGVAPGRIQRRLDRGVFQVDAEVPAEAAGRALEELRGRILRVREEPVAMAELREVRDVLTGSLPLRLETPQQLADELTTARLLAIPDSELVSYADRVSILDPADLQAAARSHIQPDELVVVVVGDAARLHGQLLGFGEVTVVDAEGTPVDPASLLPRGRSEALDASVLRPATAEYRVTFRDRPVGRALRTLEAGASGAVMTYRGTAEMGPETVVQSVVFTVPAFEVVAADTRVESGGRSTAMDLRAREGRLVGTIRLGGTEVVEVDRSLPEGALLGDMAELAVWIADLEEGKELAMPVVQPETGGVTNVTYRVVGVEDVTVPAGAFRAYRVEMGGPQPQTVWARLEPPHVPLRIEPAAQPVVLELTSSTLLGSGL